MKRTFFFIISCLFMLGCATPDVIVRNENHGDVALPNGRTRKLIKQVAPDYPPALRVRRIAGAVVVRFWVRPDGKVEKTEVRYTPHPELAPLAMAAVRSEERRVGKECRF